MEKIIVKASEILTKSNHTTIFTGAGISVESGIPPFRGENGLWNKYDPDLLDIDTFYSNPLESWKIIKEIFYDYFGIAKPNLAHKIIAELEEKKIVKAVITQNIDNLHQEAGSKKIFEFHGNSKRLICTNCKTIYKIQEVSLNQLPPLCKKCNHLLKPNFIFFGEGIPQEAYDGSLNEANIADVFVVIGTTGEVMPACMVPQMAKQNGAVIIEINTEKSAFTNKITDLFIQGKASDMLQRIVKNIFN